MAALLLVAVAAPAMAALFGLGAGPRRARLAGGAAAAAGALLFFAAAVITARVLAAGPVSAVISAPGGHAVAGLYADRITALLLLLIGGVSWVVQTFARGYLRGDAKATRFFVCASLLTAATSAMVSSATLVGLGIAWSVAGASLCLLLGLYGQLAGARRGVRSTALAFAAGDAALWGAITLALARWGDLDLRRLGSQAHTLAADGTALSVFSCLVLVAALARSAQLPFQRWLPATLSAPTPVSALLHAGVVNAGGVLLIRLSPLFGACRLASCLAFAAGAVTLLYGTTLMLAKPDVKGALAHSTIGQMGFMIMTCGLGAFAAALFHIVAHGMYKATLFLGSGTAVRTRVTQLKSPPRAPLSGAVRAAAALVSAAVAAGSVAGSAALNHPDVGGRAGSGALLIFAAATTARVCWGFLGRRPPALVAAGGLALVAAAAGGYVWWLSVLARFLAVDLPSSGQAPASPWLLALLVPVLGAVALVRRADAARGLNERLYVAALSAGHATVRARPALPRVLRPAPSLWAALEPGSEAARS